MKIVEIKNNLAKLYYQPASTGLLLSDFIVVDDNNKKLLAQVVSIETTNQPDTNCAILKFAIDISENSATAYSGYTPPLDAKVSVADKNIIEKIFANGENTIALGYLTSSTNAELNINANILNNFLYIQSDNIEQSQSLFAKIAQFNKEQNIKTLVVDFDNLTDYENICIVELCNEFKLPVSSETLNYIYENDLTGLTLEQKAIVQDIILELQEYINSLEDGYIPFETLLNVVNSIYETDKSTGVILLRNKLLKYKQSGIFASQQTEIVSLLQALENSNVVVLKTNKADLNWQKESVKFALENIDEKLCFIANINDDNAEKEFIDSLYKQSNIIPVISSKYEYKHANDLKAYAKNLILYKPIEQQKAFATYNSFLMKLAEEEYIISGEATHYTPLICKNTTERIVIKENIIDKPEFSEIEEQQGPENLNNISDIPEELTIEDNEEKIDIENIQEAVDLKLEDEISKDVDQMFYGNKNTNLEPEENVDILTDSDLDLLDDIQAEEEINDELIEIDNETIEESMAEQTEQIVLPSELTDEDIHADLIQNDFIENEVADSLNYNDSISETTFEDPNDYLLPEFSELEPNLTDDELPGFSNIDTTSEERENAQKQQKESTVPIYTVDNVTQDTESLRISEGNIVYHEKYGKGIVESIFSYGNRTLCTIQFDTTGRKLLDPNIAKLQQV